MAARLAREPRSPVCSPMGRRNGGQGSRSRVPCCGNVKGEQTHAANEQARPIGPNVYGLVRAGVGAAGQPFQSGYLAGACRCSASVQTGPTMGCCRPSRLESSTWKRALSVSPAVAAAAEVTAQYPAALAITNTAAAIIHSHRPAL